MNAGTASGENPGAVADAAHPLRTLLADASFRRLWIALACHAVGTYLTLCTVIVRIAERTTDTRGTTLVYLADAVPALVIGVLAGVVVDRVDRRRVLWASSVAGGCAGLVLLLDVRPAVVWCAAVILVQSGFAVFFGPARQSVIAATVPAGLLPSANALTATTERLAMLAGAALAGALGAGGHLRPAILLGSAAFLAGAVPALRLAPQRGAATRARGGARRDLASGFRLVRGRRVLWVTVVVGFVVMLGGGTVNILVTPYLLQDLHLSPAWIGPVEAAEVAGVLLLTAVMGTLSRHVSMPRLLTMSTIAVGLACAALATSRSIPTVALVLFLVGAAGTPMGAAATTLLQRCSDPAAVGRVMATFMAVGQAATVLSMLVGGTVAAAIGTPPTFLATGVVIVLAGGLAARLFRRPAMSCAESPGQELPGLEPEVDPATGEGGGAGPQSSPRSKAASRSMRE